MTDKRRGIRLFTASEEWLTLGLWKIVLQFYSFEWRCIHHGGCRDFNMTLTSWVIILVACTKCPDCYSPISSASCCCYQTVLKSQFFIPFLYIDFFFHWQHTHLGWVGITSRAINYRRTQCLALTLSCTATNCLDLIVCATLAFSKKLHFQRCGRVLYGAENGGSGKNGFPKALVLAGERFDGGSAMKTAAAGDTLLGLISFSVNALRRVDDALCCIPVGESPRRPFPSGTSPGGRRDKAFCISSLDGSPSRLETWRGGGGGGGCKIEREKK